MYASHSENKLAVALGYVVTIRPEVGTSFEREGLEGPRRVWSTQDGWVTADLIDHHYCNHKLYKYNELELALRRFLEEDDDA
jgi:hypothetical protein